MTENQIFFGGIKYAKINSFSTTKIAKMICLSFRGEMPILSFDGSAKYPSLYSEVDILQSAQVLESIFTGGGQEPTHQLCGHRLQIYQL